MFFHTFFFFSMKPTVYVCNIATSGPLSMKLVLYLKVHALTVYLPFAWANNSCFHV